MNPEQDPIHAEMNNNIYCFFCLFFYTNRKSLYRDTKSQLWQSNQLVWQKVKPIDTQWNKLVLLLSGLQTLHAMAIG